MTTSTGAPSRDAAERGLSPSTATPRAPRRRAPSDRMSLRATSPPPPEGRIVAIKRPVRRAPTAEIDSRARLT